MGAGADAEVASAVRAPVGHGLGVQDGGGLQAAAMRAASVLVAVAPQMRLEPLGSGRFVGEHVGKLDASQVYNSPIYLGGGLRRVEAGWSDIARPQRSGQSMRGSGRWGGLADHDTRGFGGWHADGSDGDTGDWR